MSHDGITGTEHRMKRLVYIADPMCSWCYGFVPVFEDVKTNYGADLKIQIVAGGYSPGNKNVMSNNSKEMLLLTWKKVHEVTGAEFDYAMKFATQDFCYDTEPSSRALNVVQKLNYEMEWPFLKAMHVSFYAKNQDLTEESVLADLAEEHGIDQHQFLLSFRSDDMIEQTKEGFLFSRKLGVRGFPSLVGISGEHDTLITQGYKTIHSLRVDIDYWLQT